jgi:hypothetical protein
MADEPVREPDSDEGEIQIVREERGPLVVEAHDAPGQAGDQPVREEDLSTLGDLQRDGFVLFTPALIVTHGLFDRDPIIEFNRTHETTAASERPFQVDCDHPLFQHLGKSLVQGALIDWDRRIYGVHESIWEQLRDFVGAIALFDSKRYHYAKVGYHQLKIVDVTALHGGVIQELPTVDIWVFFVSTYRYFAWMAPAKDPPRTLPFVQVDPPKPEIKAEAEAVLGPPPSPEQILNYRKSTNENPP